MMLIGDELLNLIHEKKVAPEEAFDETCIQLSLGRTVKHLVPSPQNDTLIFGQTIPRECVKKSDISDSGLLIKPHSSALAVSHEEIHIPLEYFGLLQTKGALARLMVSIHFSDGQLDPGFAGHVTFELYNGSDFSILLPYRSLVGNIYIYETRGKTRGYSGRFANSDEPTIP